MTDPNFILLYVSNAPASADFYRALLGKAPVEASGSFAMFALASGTMLGLWSKDKVAPGAELMGGGCELGFPVADAEALHGLYADWTARGLTIAQAPTEMDFGLTFVALDPDGHRLRVFAACGA